MPYKIAFRRSAERQLETIPKRERSRLLIAIAALADDYKPPHAKKLQRHHGLFRIRVGNYRAIYTGPDQEGVIDIVKIGHRQAVYQNF